MHEIELLTRSGPIILMSPTRKGLYNAFKRFLSSDSLALVDEPDETLFLYPQQPTHGEEFAKG